MEDKKCLIVAGGPETELGYVKDWVKKFHPVIFCADGGLRHLQALGIEPDWLIGDFDSVQQYEDCSAKRVILPTEKDENDTQACVRKAIELGFYDLTLVCAGGGRWDHFLCNLSVLEMAWEKGANCQLLHAENLVLFHPGGKRSYPKRDYRYLGIIPLDAVLEDVTLTGLKYTIAHQNLYRSSMISTSNEVVEDIFTVEMGKGHALIIYAEKI